MLLSIEIAKYSVDRLLVTSGYSALSVSMVLLGIG